MATYVEVIEMHIRDAVPEDAFAACEVMRRSISELCSADHHNDPVILAPWLANKTPEVVASWIVQPGNSVLVAIESDTILAVGSVTDAGEITLNYVSPDARFRGESRALLMALETRTQEGGNQRCTLLSTETAHRFYRAARYIDDGPPQGKFGANSSYPMSKELGGRARGIAGLLIGKSHQLSGATVRQESCTLANGRKIKTRSWYRTSPHLEQRLPEMERAGNRQL
jgi:hypothetical protein